MIITHYFEGMDPHVFPAAMLATVIALTVVSVGRRLGQRELAGLDRGGSDRFIFVCVAAGGVIYYFSESNPFMWALMSCLGGMLLGTGLFMGGRLLVRFLSRVRSR